MPNPSMLSRQMQILRNRNLSRNLSGISPTVNTTNRTGAIKISTARTDKTTRNSVRMARKKGRNSLLHSQRSSLKVL